MTDDLEAFVIATVEPAARAVEALAQQKGSKKVNEQSHLAPGYRTVLADSVRSTHYRTALPGERKLGDRPEWPDVGDVDALVAESGGAAWVELKCGTSHETLCACAWDAPKMALALRVGRASHAYLLAATTTKHWADRIRGAELFGKYREDDTEANRERFADWWKYWERRPDPLPVRLPARYATELVAAESFHAAGTDYELRLARVTVVSDEDYAWEPFDAVRHR